MTIKPERKVVGSITGEVWTTRSAKIPRRKLSDGRTETGREVPVGHPEYESKVEEAEEIEILIETPSEEEKLVDWKKNAEEIEDADGLEWKKAEMEFIPDSIPEDMPPEIEQEFVKGKQAPKTSAKDHDKIQDLMMGIGALFDNQPYSGEDKAVIIARLFEGTTDVRVETSQFVMSGRMYGILAMGVSVALLLKGSAGLFGNYGKIFDWPVDREANEPDVFGE